MTRDLPVADNLVYVRRGADVFPKKNTHLCVGVVGAAKRDNISSPAASHCCGRLSVSWSAISMEYMERESLVEVAGYCWNENELFGFGRARTAAVQHARLGVGERWRSPICLHLAPHPTQGRSQAVTTTCRKNTTSTTGCQHVVAFLFPYSYCIWYRTATKPGMHHAHVQDPKHPCSKGHQSFSHTLRFGGPIQHTHSKLFFPQLHIYKSQARTFIIALRIVYRIGHHDACRQVEVRLIPTDRGKWQAVNNKAAA